MATAYRSTAHGMGRDTPDDSAAAASTRLCARIAALEAELPSLSMDSLRQRVAEIGGAARRHGLLAVAGIAAELGAAIGRDGRAALIRPYLGGLREACGCAPGDSNAVHALLASISVRFAD